MWPATSVTYLVEVQLEHNLALHHFGKNAFPEGIGLMTTLYWLGVVLLVVIVAMLLRYRARHPKRADKWEKSEIVKQLLAKSELEAASRQASIRSQKPTTPNKRATRIPPKPTPVHARARRQA